jgi:lipoyl(octanoyl) transferase
VTYHGPGQRVVYLMLDLKKRAAAHGQQPDLRAYVQQLEQWIILTLAQFGIEGFLREGRVGVWVEEESRVESRESSDALSQADPRHNIARFSTLDSRHSEAKIAALGVRVQKWVTSHGVALNVNPDLSHYAGIVPCGIREFGVTSMYRMGVTVGMEEVDAVLKEKWGAVWG